MPIISLASMISIEQSFCLFISEKLLAKNYERKDALIGFVYAKLPA